MQLWVDSDACPRPIKDIVAKAAERLQVTLTFVANQFHSVPKSPLIHFVKVGKGDDVADSYILNHAAAGDVVITQDIPLAAELVELGVHAINPRGEHYTRENIRERLNMRDFMDQMRGAGLSSGGPPPLNDRDKQAFANSLDRLLTQRLRQP
jgi:hypothetical protein